LLSPCLQFLQGSLFFVTLRLWNPCQPAGFSLKPMNLQHDSCIHQFEASDMLDITVMDE
jgi:hypothetical protein